MKRKFFGTVLLLCLLTCVMGASSVSFDAGQPNPNPGGVTMKLEGTGTYAVDPGETLSRLLYFSEDTKTSQLNTRSANPKNGKWNATLDVVIGNYDCWGDMTTVNNKTLQPVITMSPVVNKNVK